MVDAGVHFMMVHEFSQRTVVATFISKTDLIFMQFSSIPYHIFVFYLSFILSGFFHFFS